MMRRFPAIQDRPVLAAVQVVPPQGLTALRGAPPGQHLRPGRYMAANEAGQTSKISSIKVSTLSGEPRM
jgi:hypothetical protein